METSDKTVITVEAKIDAPVEKVWEAWNEPAHITQWCSASEEWHTPKSENDLRPGGQFLSRMEARDGSMGFDFSGIYDEVIQNKFISYTIADGRKVEITFTDKDGQTYVSESFEAEGTNPVEMQQGGWQAILDSFKRYAEAL